MRELDDQYLQKHQLRSATAKTAFAFLAFPVPKRGHDVEAIAGSFRAADDQAKLQCPCNQDIRNFESEAGGGYAHNR